MVTQPRIWASQQLAVQGTEQLARLVARKEDQDLGISVCLPALNEAGTIGTIVSRIRAVAEAGLIDQLLVIDSGSSDETLDVAAAAGAEVFEATRILPEVDAPGKGGTLWKSLSVVAGDIVVWLDSDTRNFDASFVTQLVAPLLEDPLVRLTKAFYERPLEQASGALTTGGARVTELVVRPLSHLLFPELTGFVQPLSGEYAGYRGDLIELPFFTGYGIEVGLLIDFIEMHGVDPIRQVDLGSRVHRNQDILALGRMAYQVLQVMTKRADDLGRLKMGAEWPEEMVQFVTGKDQPTPVSHTLRVLELPPLKNFL